MLFASHCRTGSRKLPSELDRSCRTTGLTLEQGCSILLNEVGIRSATLAAFDVAVHVVCDGLLDSLDSILQFEVRPWSLARSQLYHHASHAHLFCEAVGRK